MAIFALNPESGHERTMQRKVSHFFPKKLSKSLFGAAWDFLRALRGNTKGETATAFVCMSRSEGFLKTDRVDLSPLQKGFCAGECSDSRKPKKFYSF